MTHPGLTPHHIIDALLDTLTGNAPLPNSLTFTHGQALYFLKSGNKENETNGNWRIVMDTNDLLIQVRAGGTWTTEARFTP